MATNTPTIRTTVVDLYIRTVHILAPYLYIGPLIVKRIDIGPVIVTKIYNGTIYWSQYNTYHWLALRISIGPIFGTTSIMTPIMSTEQ